MNLRAIREACETILAEIDDPGTEFDFRVFAYGQMFVEQCRTKQECPEVVE